MHTVVETPSYLIAAAKAGMTDAERAAAVDVVSTNPQAGTMVQKTGGVRKVRIAKEGGGKSGGYRVLTFYVEADEPVFLLTVINKSKSADLTEEQKKILKQVAKALKSER